MGFAEMGIKMNVSNGSHRISPVQRELPVVNARFREGYFYDFQDRLALVRSIDFPRYRCSPLRYEVMFLLPARPHETMRVLPEQVQRTVFDCDIVSVD